MNAIEEITKTLNRVNARLVRHSNSAVYALPNGMKFVMPKQLAQNGRAPQNALSRLRHCLNETKPKPGNMNPIDEVISATLRSISTTGVFLPPELLLMLRKLIVNEQNKLIQLPEPAVTRFYDELTIQWELEDGFGKTAVVIMTASADSGVVLRSGWLDITGFQDTCRQFSLAERLDWLLTTATAPES